MTEIASEISSELIDVIDSYGDTITIYGINSNSYSDYYHDRTPTYDSGTSAKGLIIRTSNELMKEQEGELQRPRPILMYIKSTTTIDINYKITHRNIDYLVTFQDLLHVEDTILFYKVELTRIDST